MVTLLTGCTTTLTGHETRAPDPPPGPDGVTTARLDPGNYPTKPAPPLGNAGKLGGVVEAQRMAEFTVLPSDVDATITQSALLEIGTSALPVGTAKSIDLVISDGASDVAAAHHFIAGFSTARRSELSGHGKAITNMVMRFPDRDSAADAATQMAALPSPTPSPRTPVPVPRHPEALASTFDTRDATNSHVVESYTPHGSYVLYQYANAEESLDVAAQLVATTLDLQAPRIDAFVPTDPDRLADLPRDPTGLFAATLRLPPDDESFVNGVYSARGALQFEPDPAQAAALFDAVGVEAVAISKAVVYQAKDHAGAQRIADAITADSGSDKPLKALPGIPGLPSAKCFDLGKSDKAGDTEFDCIAVAGRYAYRTFSHQDADVRQQTAAQYLMLTAKT
jgi:hypothetical protein